MTYEGVDLHDLEWEGGVLIHDTVEDWYYTIMFGDCSNDPNDYDCWPECVDDPFDDYIMVNVYKDGYNLRAQGWCNADSDDGVMIPIHRREHPSGQIRDWFDKACDVANILAWECEFVSMLGRPIRNGIHIMKNKEIK